MPNYNAQNPPYSIFPGDVALAFNSEAPAAGQSSQQFALPSYAGFPENGRAAERDPGKRRVCSPSVQTVETMQCFEDDRRGGNRNWPSAQIREAESGVPAEFRDLNCKTTAHCRAVSDR